MKFFDRFPPPDPIEPEPAEQTIPLWAKPDTTLGGSVPWGTVLARGDDAVLGVSSLVAYPNGFSFSVLAVLRHEDRRGRALHQAIHGDFFDSEPPAPEFLRVGVQFADGSGVTNLGPYPHFPPGNDPDGPLLLRDGASGGGRRFEASYWVWPLPPAGPLTFVCAWPAYGIGESTVEIDGGLIHDAAARSVSLWPDD